MVQLPEPLAPASESQKSSMQPPPGGTQMPQLALQHSSLTSQVTAPQATPPGAVSPPAPALPPLAGPEPPELDLPALPLEFEPPGPTPPPAGCAAPPVPALLLPEPAGDILLVASPASDAQPRPTTAIESQPAVPIQRRDSSTVDSMEQTAAKGTPRRGRARGLCGFRNKALFEQLQAQAAHCARPSQDRAISDNP